MRDCQNTSLFYSLQNQPCHDDNYHQATQNSKKRKFNEIIDFESHEQSNQIKRMKPNQEVCGFAYNECLNELSTEEQYSVINDHQEYIQDQIESVEGMCDYDEFSSSHKLEIDSYHQIMPFSAYKDKINSIHKVDLSDSGLIFVTRDTQYFQNTVPLEKQYLKRESYIAQHLHPFCHQQIQNKSQRSSERKQRILKDSRKNSNKDQELVQKQVLNSKFSNTLNNGFPSQQQREVHQYGFHQDSQLMESIYQRGVMSCIYMR
ncbi:UNKNOWN [Stylonychia lemnae]|uniref:Uncharacterized protein n=1 Tax=Stylonychia lemnae TaxID=5949 RepID=A0A078B7S0_STYLE|nr:UNKNOWN [Stylonychia lemnae]|eukprot:CDW90271.1 UNKNOWN [Stylonychia lemnae]